MGDFRDKHLFSHASQTRDSSLAGIDSNQLYEAWAQIIASSHRLNTPLSPAEE